ncbi:MAG: putative DNA-binding protein [Angelakisella sp.]|nr:putative DNA-binding protein [Angelakisella sp.]
MAKNLEISLLLDFYGDMLTEKQRDVVELYYNEDLSLAEIATHSGITRQGVRDSIKRAESQLLDYEDRLRLAGRFRKIQAYLDEITDLAKDIERINDRFGASQEIYNRTGRIVTLAGEISEAE